MITLYEEKLGFPKEASDFFEESYAKIASLSDRAEALKTAMSLYFECETTEEVENILARISEESGVHRFTVDMIFLLTGLDELNRRYHEKGYSEELFLDTMRDLKYKLLECRQVYGIWGISVFFWYHRFFVMDLFALGRLQFHHRPLQQERYKDILKKGDNVFACHIPSSGPLRLEDVMDSLKRAYEFYSDELVDGVLRVHCGSWLLYPPHAEHLFPEGSNLKKFYDLFDIFETKQDPENKDFFRVFGKKYSEDLLKNVEIDTTLKRNLKQYLLDGNCMGSGYGIILFDGEKIISKHE